MVSGNIFGKFLQATGVPSIRRKSNIYGGEDDASMYWGWNGSNF